MMDLQSYCSFALGGSTHVPDPNGSNNNKKQVIDFFI
jgi:hypothetical protein